MDDFENPVGVNAGQSFGHFARILRHKEYAHLRESGGILSPVNEGGWFTPAGMFLLAPAAFFIIAAIIWALRTWKPEQQEKD